MEIGKVTGTVVTTIGHPHFKNRKLLVIQPMLSSDEKPGEDFIALDTTSAGIGDTVLVNREGNGARAVLNNPDGAVISIVVGIIDSLHIAEHI